jgi:hypothetical protein
LRATHGRTDTSLLAMPVSSVADRLRQGGGAESTAPTRRRVATAKGKSALFPRMALVYVIACLASKGALAAGRQRSLPAVLLRHPALVAPSRLAAHRLNSRPGYAGQLVGLNCRW